MHQYLFKLDRKTVKVDNYSNDSLILEQKMNIPVANPKAQCMTQKDELIEAITKVFDSCHFILGENVTQIEKTVAEICDAKYGIAVNSGTDAIVIALAACGVSAGDEVITTPYTFVATNEAIMNLGAKPVYVDIDPKDFNIDVTKIEAAITPKTKAILPVHLYGQCCDIEKIDEIAKRHNIKVVADGAQAIGAKRFGKAMGAFGDASTISFYPTKNLGACGDGGMIVTNDEDINEAARSLRFHGMANGYYYKRIGFCSRLDEIQAAVLNVKVKKLAQWNEARRTHAHYYIENLSDLPIELPIAHPDNYHIYHQFTIKYAKRDALQKGLADNGVGSAVFYPAPLHIHDAYKMLGYKEGDFPISESVAKQVLSLPVFPELGIDNAKIVADTIRKVVCELENEL